MPGVADRLHAGGIGVTPVRKYYAIGPDSEVVDPEAAVALRLAAAKRAIADGYTGFRAAVDATAVTRSREGRDAFARLEFLIDRLMVMHPISALCAYDLNRLADTAAELICLHPFVNQGGATFRVYAESDVGCVLSGEVDAASDELFATVVGRTWSLTGDGTLVIDAQQLEFIGHRQLLALDDDARVQDRKVVLRTGQSIVTRLAALLDLTNVEVAPHGASMRSTQ